MVDDKVQVPFNPLAQAAEPASQNIPNKAVNTKSTWAKENLNGKLLLRCKSSHLWIVLLLVNI